MISSEALSKWAKHRLGKEKLEAPALEIIALSLQDNRNHKSFLDSFGKRTFQGYVGFLDLVGFSSRVRGKSAEDVGRYLAPFLNTMIGRITGQHAMIDKTIGDEIMFVMPDLAHEDEGPPADVTIGRLLAAIRYAQRQLGQDYPIRVGVAWGDLYLQEVGGPDFKEWSVFGEIVNLAKRLHTLPLLEAPKTIACAIGVLGADVEANTRIKEMQNWLMNAPWRIQEIPSEETAHLKGTSPSRAVYFLDGCPD
jgi:hypothetical protein